MDHLPITTNQIRMSSIPVSDYPFEKNHKLSIDNEKVFITFDTYGKKYILIQ